MAEPAAKPQGLLDAAPRKPGRPAALGRVTPERRPIAAEPAATAAAALLAAAAPLAPPHSTVRPLPALAATPSADLLPARLEPLLDGARGAVLTSAAHLRVDAGGGAGEIALHLRLRDGVADVRMEGGAAEALASRSAELSRALAAEGISLRRLEADPPAPTSAPAQPQAGTSGGDAGTAGRDRGGPGDAERREPGGREPSAPAALPHPAPPRRAPRAGLDVEA